MMGCKKCQFASGLLVLIVGILFLIENLTTWEFWGIQWYTAFFLLWGIGSLGMRSCHDCQAVMKGKK